MKKKIPRDSLAEMEDVGDGLESEEYDSEVASADMVEDQSKS